MSDAPAITAAEEFAALVADVHAHLEALRATAAVHVRAGPVPGLPDAPRDASPLPSAGAAPRAWTPPPREPRPATEPSSGARGAAPARVEPARIEPARPQNPPPSVAPRPAAAAPPASAGAGLFGGKWAALASDPAEELARLRRDLPARCARCDIAPPRGEGPARARFAAVLDPLDAAAGDIFARMLVNVLVLERSDVLVYTVQARCDACSARVVAELGIVRPQVIGLFGPVARGLVGLEPGGEGRFGDIAAIATWHPAEFVASADRKRPAFEHLKAIARRL